MRGEVEGGRKKVQDYSYLPSDGIGKGYSSQVFKGRNDLTAQPVAVKVIDLRMLKGDVHRTLLASELDILRSLKLCDNIIQLHGICSTKSHTYIVTQLCEGGDLAKLIATRKKLPESEAAGLMNHILNGYHALHSRGIIHRDLKPANVLLRAGEPKIADFGFAMKQADSKKYSSYNVGSPVYMPPEALSDNKYSFKSDIWALGVIYYEMLTGRTPWRAKTEKELARMLQSVPIAKVMPPSLSSASEQFLCCTLNADPQLRAGPEELRRLMLPTDSQSVVSRGLYVTENSVLDGRNNTIRKHEGRETSLSKQTFTPSNRKRMTLGNLVEEKGNNVSLPKTSATICVTSGSISSTTGATFSSITGKTEHVISSKQFAPNGETSSNKQMIGVSTAQSSYDKKQLSKQLLSQIHFCRFLFKLLMRMKEKLSEQTNSSLGFLQELMAGLIFEKLDEVYQLKPIGTKQAIHYKSTGDYHKIAQIIEQYRCKYGKELVGIKRNAKTLGTLKDQLGQDILWLYGKVNEGQESAGQQWREQVVVLDYLVTLRQLASLLQSQDLDGFHSRSKIEAIVEGTPAQNITQEHLNAIRAKLKAIKLI